MGDLPLQLWPIVLLFVFLWVFPLWRIVKRAGYHPAISLLAIFPVFGLILLWWLAFARWPSIDEQEHLRQVGVADHMQRSR
jgi:hypothetical protein